MAFPHTETSAPAATPECESPDAATPQAIAADVRLVAEAYRERRRAGEKEYRAFLAAIRAFRRRHPDMPPPAAAHAVTQLMRTLDRSARA